MCEPAPDSTNPPTVDGNGTYARFVDRLTTEVRDALATHARTNGTTTLTESACASATPSDTLAATAWRERQRLRQKQAREAGTRAGTVCGRWRNERRVPDLRLTGRWLEAAGFSVGQEFLVLVDDGRLIVTT